MNRLPIQQKGASIIGTIIVLAVLGYVAYLGMQYVPQFIEAKSIDSILHTLDADNTMDPASSEDDAKERIIKLLQINEMDDMIPNFSFRDRDGKITVKVKYERKLDLLYTVKPMLYEKSVELK